MPKPIPISEYAPGWYAPEFDEDGDPVEMSLFLGELDGKPAWSNGHVMMVGNPPAVTVEGRKTQSFDRFLERWHAAGTPERVEPRVVTMLGATPSVVFPNRLIINVKYYDLISARFPQGEWWTINPRTALVVKSAGEIVGMVMPMAPDGWQKEITAALEAVKPDAPQLQCGAKTITPDAPVPEPQH